MLNKTLIKLNLTILKSEKVKLLYAIKHNKEGVISDKESTIKHIEKLEIKVCNIEKIIEFFQSELSVK